MPSYKDTSPKNVLIHAPSRTEWTSSVWDYRIERWVKKDVTYCLYIKMKFTQKSFFLSKTPWDLHQQAYNSPSTMMINISRMKKLISEKNACFDDNGK